MPFGRKLLWVQGGFTVLTIIAFGVLTLSLHDELMRRTRCPCLSFFLFYWTARVTVDVFHFSHEEWPKCRQFVIGHILRTALFSALAFTTYLGLFVAGLAKS
jgi:hypothetical protein